MSRFTDNEARLFFSKFILFVEGETELELFGHKKLLNYFPLLKKIDIYKSTDLTKIRNINPSYSKTNIPYYILYDLDKVVDIKEKYNLINENYSFSERYKESLKMYPSNTNLGLKIPDYKKMINYLSNNLKYEFNYSTSDDIMIDSFTCDKLVIGKYKWKDNDYKTYLSHLKNYLYHENIIIADTTIENVIINKNTIKIFIKWLLHEVKVNTQLIKYNKLDSYKNLKDNTAKKKYHKEVKYLTSKYIKDTKQKNNILFNNYLKNKKFISSKTKYYKCCKNHYTFVENSNNHFNKFFNYQTVLNKEDNDLELNELNYLNKVKKQYLLNLNSIINKIEKTISEDEFVYLFVVLFNGKTQCLRDKKFFNKKTKKLFSQNLKTITDLFSSINYFFGRKTSNWLTCFLDYYLVHKEQVYSSELNQIKKIEIIREDFKNDFKDLYAIINSINLKLAE
ncbi:TOPRIM nucleotidyl transferase/hydrolase domain-containing protein [Arcobacter sp. YIC-80]|uniref:TOPRIM nucleotidyl transferase/hydrolase domain-containing protein n=1 Tax=Arcobacter sp. YIC-80 TaxID=3376683 RepID=UPI00384EB32C